MEISICVVKYVIFWRIFHNNRDKDRILWQFKSTPLTKMRCYIQRGQPSIISNVNIGTVLNFFLDLFCVSWHEKYYLWEFHSRCWISLKCFTEFSSFRNWFPWSLIVFRSEHVLILYENGLIFEIPMDRDQRWSTYGEELHTKIALAANITRRIRVISNKLEFSWINKR